jgi:two-component system sensor histidine kinase DesK
VTNRKQRLIDHFFSLVWLLFLAYPVAVFVQTHPSTASLVAGLLGLVTFMAIYTWLWIRLYAHRPTAGVAIAWISLSVIALILTLAGGPLWSSLCMFVVASFAGYVSDWRRGVAATVIITALMSGLALLGGAGAWTFAIALEGLLVGTVVIASVVMRQTNSALHAAREDAARLMVAEERLRFARDLHDLLGHSLSVIVLKAELAGKLTASSPTRAAAELADIERVAREALADVRGAVSGYREASLAIELEKARSALAAAGVKVDVEQMREGLPATTDSVLAWSLREGVTNVIRHSGATAASIRLAWHDGKAELELTDDGRGAPDFQPGNGLTGLRERVAGRQGEVEFGPRATGGFRLRVSVPL